MLATGPLHIETIPIRGTSREFRLICDCHIGRDHDYEEWRERFSPTLLHHRTAGPTVGTSLLSR